MLDRFAKNAVPAVKTIEAPKVAAVNLEDIAGRSQAVIDAGRFQPQTEEGLEALAWKYYRSGWLPDCYYPKDSKQRWEKWAIEQGVARAFIVMLKGAAYGMNPSDAIWQIHVINNRPCPSADLMFGRMLATGILKRDDFSLKASKTGCTIVLGIKSRAPEDRIVVEAKYEDFQHLHKKDNWTNHPEDMLVARCKARASRRWAPDLNGSVYTAEEMRDLREDVAVGVYEVPVEMMPPADAPRPPPDVAAPNHDRGVEEQTSAPEVALSKPAPTRAEWKALRDQIVNASDTISPEQIDAMRAELARFDEAHGRGKLLEAWAANGLLGAPEVAS